ncbi:hypothetical protein Xish_03115 [Xenorhabdus ishibashii]|uniref:Uncharacterized protein n=1 Tax=Xenorhabdus ishibashii TaxID=1034471 RepID=A0A2D0KK82_9GAMM|nr:hypothetical protein Xish_03115 [Xenorhabdus ishibashii]
MNIENNIIKLSESCLPGKLCVSIPDGSDIIIGQSVYLTAYSVFFLRNNTTRNARLTN